MRRFTKSRQIAIPTRAIRDLLNGCNNDDEAWTILFANGLTLMIKPTTQSEKEFHREEEMVYNDIQEHGLDDATLWKNRWSL